MTAAIARPERWMALPALAQLVADLSAAGLGEAELGPADVYVLGTGPAADKCAARLSEGIEPFGMRIVPVPATRPGVCAVSMHRPGPPAVWSEDEVDDLIEDVRAERLGHWTQCATVSPQIRTLHRPGSDSIGVIEFDCVAGRLVAKVGPEDVMLVEQEHVLRTHDSGARIFPVPHGYDSRAGVATRIMDAAEDAGFVERIFSRGPDGLLRASASEISAVDEHLRILTAWHADSLADGEPEVAKYLYVDRLLTLPTSELCSQVGEGVLGRDAYREAFETEVILPDGSRTSYRELVSWVRNTYAEWHPTQSAVVHGDIFTSNLMRGQEGEPRFIDPRSAWDGAVNAQAGRGDPVFDLGTLLHAVSPMVTILDACARGAESRLLPEGALATGHVDARATVSTADIPARAVYVSRVADLTRDWADPGSMVRLHVASACSLLGWLKYPKVVRTTDAWWSVFLAVVADLARARRVHEGLDPAFTHDSDAGDL